MEREKIHPQTIVRAIMHYWGELQGVLGQAQEGIQGNNFILMRDSAVMAKGYLDIISKYADKVIADICVVTEDAKHEDAKHEDAKHEDAEHEDAKHEDAKHEDAKHALQDDIQEEE